MGVGNLQFSGIDLCPGGKFTKRMGTYEGEFTKIKKKFTKIISENSIISVVHQ